MPKPQFESLQPVEFEPTNCPVCQNREFSKGYSKTIIGYPIKYVKCRSCASLYTNPRVTDKSLKNIYASSDFFEGKDNNLNYYSFLAGKEYLSRTAKSRLDRISQHTKGRDLLEVASAAGFFLNQAKLAGFNATGVEISKPMAEWASETWNVPVIAESIDNLQLSSETYDIVANWGVFTILRNPGTVLENYHQALRPGGILAFNTYYNEAWWG